MFNAKFLLFVFLLLAADAFAARINYSAKYKDGDKTSRTSKNGNVPDDKEQLIIDNMKTWSNDRFEAGKSRHNIIQVTNIVEASSKGAASQEVQDMQHIVNQNI